MGTSGTAMQSLVWSILRFFGGIRFFMFFVFFRHGKRAKESSRAEIAAPVNMDRGDPHSRSNRGPKGASGTIMTLQRLSFLFGLFFRIPSRIFLVEGMEGWPSKKSLSGFKDLTQGEMRVMISSVE